MTETVKERLSEYLKAKRITKAEFGRSIGVSASYVTSMRDNGRASIGVEKIERIRQRYPDLNIEWLLTGEGNMLNDVGISQSVNGNDNVTLAGHNMKVESDKLLEKAFDEIKAQREMTQKAQEQVDRLLTILEKVKL
mgnify:CR=1 FL=1